VYVRWGHWCAMNARLNNSRWNKSRGKREREKERERDISRRQILSLGSKVLRGGPEVGNNIHLVCRLCIVYPPVLVSISSRILKFALRVSGASCDRTQWSSSVCEFIPCDFATYTHIPLVLRARPFEVYTHWRGGKKESIGTPKLS